MSANDVIGLSMFLCFFGQFFLCLIFNYYFGSPERGLPGLRPLKLILHTRA
jgi:hypothetical protein